MLPNFIVIGQAKCGTTSLCDLLRSHPEIYFSDPKEPRYFSNQENFGDPSLLENYENLFSGVSDEKAVGEGTTTYTHPEIAGVVAQRIAAAIPHCKIIFMVRHPLRRLESDWRMRLHEQWAEKDINDAVKANPSLITHSLYWKNYEPYTQLFPEQQRLVVFLEEFSASPDAELKKCFEFVGVDTQQKLADAGTKRNDSKKFRSDSWMLSKLRNSSHFHTLKDAIPDDMVRWGKRLLSREQRFSLDWRPEVRREVLATLRGDADKFLAYCNKPSDHWNLSDEQ